MIYSELELKKMVNNGLGNLSVDDEIKFNILNFIHGIHLNKQDFLYESYNSEFFGNLNMVFTKKPLQIFGSVRVVIKDECRKMVFIFNDSGYELAEDIINS
jgi:hypothetical protein